MDKSFKVGERVKIKSDAWVSQPNFPGKEFTIEELYNCGSQIYAREQKGIANGVRVEALEYVYKYQIGEKVRCRYNDNGTNQYVGDYGTITGYSDLNSNYPYRVSFAMGLVAFNEEELESYNDSVDPANNLVMDDGRCVDKNCPACYSTWPGYVKSLPADPVVGTATWRSLYSASYDLNWFVQKTPYKNQIEEDLKKLKRQ